MNRITTILAFSLYRPTAQALVVFHSSTLQLNDPAYQQTLQTFRSRVNTLAQVSSVTLGGTGKDGRTIVIALGFRQDTDAVASHLATVRAMLPHSGPVQAFLTGDAAIFDEIQLDSQKDIETAELFTLPLTLLVLLWVFGSMVASCVPLLLATVVVSTTLASIYLVTLCFSVNIFAQSMVTILGLGLAIDYSLILLRRFREELTHSSVCEAVAKTVATAGEAICLVG